MGLAYKVKGEFYHVGTYSEAHYFNQWLELAGVSALPVEDGEPMQPKAAAWHLENWLPRVEELLKSTGCVWAGDEPGPEYTPDADGSRRITDREYPLRVTVGEQSGIITIGGFRAGCPPSEFLATLQGITSITRKALEASIAKKARIYWS